MYNRATGRRAFRVPSLGEREPRRVHSFVYCGGRRRANANDTDQRRIILESLQTVSAPAVAVVRGCDAPDLFATAGLCATIAGLGDTTFRCFTITFACVFTHDLSSFSSILSASARSRFATNSRLSE